MTVVAAVVVLVTFVLAATVASVCGAVVARSRARSAADLAALAGAAATVSDARAPCDVVAAVVDRGPGSLVGCEVEADGTVRVVTRVPAAPWGAATARAHAGLAG